MKNKAIGKIILKGGTAKDIRKEIPDFPLDPSKEYFCSLGYKESTAYRYWAKLQQNSPIASVDLGNTVGDGVEKEPIIQSKDADFNNLLIDTSALEHNTAKKFIDKSSKVTFINAIIEEMDKKKDFKKNPILASKIRDYINKILKNPDEKYMLSTFSGLQDERYPDNILLQYQLILPSQIRPTILTADKGLAVKALMWHLPYILIETIKNEDSVEASLKPLGYGIYLFSSKSETFAQYLGVSNCFIITPDGAKLKLTGQNGRVVHSGDKICLQVKDKLSLTEKVFEIP